MQESYWTGTLRQRITRRRALAFTGSASIAALLAACSGGDNKPGDSNKSNLVFTPVDRTKEAKKGGILPQAIGEESTSWNPTQSGSQLRSELYSTILQPKSAIGKAPIGEYVGVALPEWKYTHQTS